MLNLLQEKRTQFLKLQMSILLDIFRKKNFFHLIELA